MADDLFTTITEAEARLGGCKGDPRQAGFQLTQIWPLIDASLAPALIVTLNATTTITGPKADGVAYSGTFQVSSIGSEGLGNRSVTIFRRLTKTNAIADIAALNALTPLITGLRDIDHPFGDVDRRDFDAGRVPRYVLAGANAKLQNVPLFAHIPPEVAPPLAKTKLRDPFERVVYWSDAVISLARDRCFPSNFVELRHRITRAPGDCQLVTAVPTRSGPLFARRCRAAQAAEPLSWDAERAVELAGQVLECDQARQLDDGVIIEMVLQPVDELVADR